MRLIDADAAINAISEMMPTPYTPDGSHPADEGIFIAQELFADCIQTIEKLPSAQPEDWMERNKERILQAEMEGREIEFRIGGRLFAIKEKAQ